MPFISDAVRLLKGLGLLLGLAIVVAIAGTALLLLNISYAIRLRGIKAAFRLGLLDPEDEAAYLQKTATEWGTPWP